MAKRKLTQWQRLVKQEFAKGKKMNKGFKFSQALKNAKANYTKKIDTKYI